MQRWGSLPAIEMREFYARRAARILPSLLLIVVVLAVMHALAVPDYTIDRAGFAAGPLVGLSGDGPLGGLSGDAPLGGLSGDAPLTGHAAPG